MKVLVESRPAFSEKVKACAWTCFQVILGSLFLAALSQVQIPLYPIPMTLQTLGVFFLAIGQGEKKAFSSVLLYLVFAACGLPILAEGASSSLWFFLPSAGYLIGFLIASYVIGKMVYSKENPSSLWVMGSLLVGQMIIYTLGIGCLMRILSFKQSLMVGLIPFLPLAGLKLLIGTSLGGLWIRFSKR